MTDEVQKVEVDEMNRPILASHCHAVRIDRAILLIADVTEYRQTIVTKIARTTIVVIENIIQPNPGKPVPTTGYPVPKPGNKSTH